MLKTYQFLSKSIIFNTFLGILLLGATQNIDAQSNEVNSYGSEFKVQEKVDATSNVFENLALADKETAQLQGTITEVCQAKGCWMKVNLNDGEEVFVRFKDYGFFVPTDSAGKDVVMNGLAFVEEMSVEDQQHYAMDKGATKEEIKKIQKPKRTLGFEADGVRIADSF